MRDFNNRGAYQYQTYRPGLQNSGPRQTADSPKKQIPRPLLATLVSGVLIITFLGYKGLGFMVHGHAAQAAAVAAQPTRKVPPKIDTTEMDKEIQAVIDANPSLQIGVTYIDLKTGDSRQLGISAPYVAASVNKLLSASYYLATVDDNQRSLDTSIDGTPAKELLRRMIVESDNNAWASINAELGKPNIQNYARSVGLNSYVAADNLITTNDIATLLQKIYTKQLLSNNSTTFLLDLMKQASKTDYIVNNVPSGVPVYHKAGWLDDRAHDAAIIGDGNRPYVLVVFTKAPIKESENANLNVFKMITQSTTKTFLST